MKKTTLIVLACLTPLVTMAHELPVPHAHSEYVHGIVPFIKYILLPVAIGFGALKCYRYLKGSGQA